MSNANGLFSATTLTASKKENKVERLDMSLAPERPNIEASIHFARYAIATPFAKGKKVLDIACGEGYGSHLLKRAGAEQVVGVDVSEDAVGRARKSFAAPGVEFLTADAQSIEREFPPGHFDVVVSCETIEHIEHPEKYLQSLKNVAKKDAVFIISCPNDHWYFPEDHQRNPYHLRKYRFDEFKELTSRILGENVSWSVGTAVMGFGSTPLDVKADYQPVPSSWMSSKQLDGAYLVNGTGELDVTASNCSYFFGVWNAADAPSGAAVFPVSMDSYARMVQALEDPDSVSALRAQADASRSEVRRVGLLYQASTAENEVLRESLHFSSGSVHALQAQVTALQAEAYRFQTEAHALQAEGHDLKAQLYGLQAEATARQSESKELQAQSHALQMQVSAFQLEVPTLQAEIAALREECAYLRIAHDRYVRLRKLVPQPVRALAVKVARAVRG